MWEGILRMRFAILFLEALVRSAGSVRVTREHTHTLMVVAITNYFLQFATPCRQFT